MATNSPPSSGQDQPSLTWPFATLLQEFSDMISPLSLGQMYPQEIKPMKLGEHEIWEAVDCEVNDLVQDDLENERLPHRLMITHDDQPISIEIDHDVMRS